MTMFKLETMIYASEDGTSSVFTLNPALQKQLDSQCGTPDLIRHPASFAPCFPLAHLRVL